MRPNAIKSSGATETWNLGGEFMIPVKIVCGCGQHYAFEVEPEIERLATAIACPACGADGTPAANEMIARSQAKPPAASGGALRLSRAESAAPSPLQPAAAGARSALHASQLGMVGRDQAEIEARAKISWGDTSEDVIKYLMMQGFELTEASDMVHEMVRERTAATRVNGVKKIVTGIGLAFVPIVMLIVFHFIGAMSFRLLSIGIAIGFWGLWKIITGTLLIVAPKMEKGDVANQ